MPCRKCGSFAVETSDALCHQCSIFEHSRVYMTPEAIPSAPPQWFETACPRYYLDCIAEQATDGLLRMPWDVYFLSICDAVKARSIDQDTQNGAVIVNEHRRLVSTGYNAFPAGVDDTFWPKDRTTKVAVPKVGFTGHPGKSAASTYDPNKSYAVDDVYSVDKYFAMTHAEMNAVVAAGQDLHGCCIYTLLFPCHECAKAIITSGIKRVVFTVTREDPSWAVAKELFLQSGVELVGPEKP